GPQAVLGVEERADHTLVQLTNQSGPGRRPEQHPEERDQQREAEDIEDRRAEVARDRPRHAPPVRANEGQEAAVHGPRLRAECWVLVVDADCRLAPASPGNLTSASAGPR